MTPIPSTGDLVAAYRPPDYDLIATPSTGHDVSYGPEDNGPGAGSVSINMHDAAAVDIDVNDVIAIRRNGETAAALLVEEIDQHTLDQQEKGAHRVSYIGRLVGGQMEWAVVFPAGGVGWKPFERDAVFDSRSLRYTPATYGDTWVNATEIMSVADAKAGDYPHQPMGSRFDAATGAMMIADASGTDTLADPFWRLFYRDITVTTPGRYGLEVLMDDLGRAAVSGVDQLDVRPEDGFVTASFKRLMLSTGTQRLWFAIYNIEDPDNPGLGLGPCALAYNLYKTDLQDKRLAGGDLWVSDSNTKVMYVGDGDWPGMTVGDILTQLLAEAQARGALTWIVPSFDELEDSNGDPFDRVLGITTKTRFTSYLKFLDELVAAGHISRWRLRPDGVTLDVFAPGYSNRPGDVELEPAPVNDPRSGQLVQLDRRIT